MWRIFQLILVLSVSWKCQAINPGNGTLNILNLSRGSRGPKVSSSFNIFKSEFSDPNTLLKAYQLVVELANVLSPDPYPLQTLSSGQRLENIYDYIIVGGGTAGSTLAARLSEIPQNRILLLDAGFAETGFSVTPGTNQFLPKSYLVWDYSSEPEKYSARGMKHRSVPTYVSKLLGGGSAHNQLEWVRGEPQDYDRWVQLGADGWSWRDLFPYFVKSEKIIKSKLGQTLQDEGYHGSRGPVRVTGIVEPSPAGRYIIEGIREIGLPIGDFNGKNHSRFNFYPINVYGGVRQSMALAYLSQASFRKNLDVILEALVHKVLFNDRKEAIGVLFEKDGKIQKVMTRKEIIISAGVFNSPRILMLSGIGPKQELKKHGIPILVESPGVGQNLQDHPATLLHYTSRPNTSAVYTRGDSYVEAAEEYKASGTGSFATPGTDIGGWFRSSKALDQRGDVNIVLFNDWPGSFLSNFLYGYLYGYSDKLVEEYLVPQALKDGFLIQVSNYRARSKGVVRLRSRNIHDPPIIEPRYFSTGDDIDPMIEGCQLVAKIMRSKAVRQGLNAQPFPNTLPGCERYPLDSNDFFRCVIQTITVSSYHPSCTCKMGSLSDLTAVVDPQLRVKGVKGLRVIDASIFPEVPSGNLNSQVLAMAERASDLIKGRLLKPTLPPYKNEGELLSYD
ncbi:L-sorbose 1-dehydrogenase-like [Brevipalpus obovatus]|uniref:L-sorbose 1-dehydrogenase-like n=1 Tax=Brevipalpus obovatus TaxID=246614 RepID=UPI003D9E95FA